MDTIRIHDVRIDGRSIKAKISADGKVREAFSPGLYVTQEYKASIDMTGLPESIAVLPILGNILPISWIYDAEIRVDSCDRDFYESIPEFKKGYVQMYPGIHFGGSLTVGNIVENAADKEGALCLYSGGADAINTTLMHIRENPVLLTVRGADVSKADEWAIVTQRNAAAADALGLKYVTVESNFRKIIRTFLLDTKVMAHGDAWCLPACV